MTRTMGQICRWLEQQKWVASARHSLRSLQADRKGNPPPGADVTLS